MPGGANWNNPTVTRLYATEILPDIKTRDEDALTLLGGTAPTNIPTGAMKYNRSTHELQEWDGAAFNAVYFAVTSGGTGATTTAAARTNLGIGTLGTQNSNAISVTGGSISGLTSLGVTGDATISGKLIVSSTAADAIDVLGGINAGSGNVGIIGSDGRIPALTTTYIADISALSSAIPAGLIAMFDAACPSGWTRFTPLDNKFPMGKSAYDATGGGTSTHSHTVNSHTHSTPSGTSGATDVNHAHTYSGTTGDASASGTAEAGATTNTANAVHNHGYSGTTAGATSSLNHTHSIPSGTSGAATPGTDSQNHTPPWIGMVYCKKN